VFLFKHIQLERKLRGETPSPEGECGFECTEFLNTHKNTCNSDENLIVTMNLKNYCDGKVFVTVTRIIGVGIE
jgi:hypothetical protein